MTEPAAAGGGFVIREIRPGEHEALGEITVAAYREVGETDEPYYAEQRKRFTGARAADDRPEAPPELPPAERGPGPGDAEALYFSLLTLYLSQTLSTNLTNCSIPFATGAVLMNSCTVCALPPVDTPSTMAG